VRPCQELSWKLALSSAGAALFAAAGCFVDSSPGPRLGVCPIHSPGLVAGNDVCRLTLLFVRVAGFIALRHGIILSIVPKRRLATHFLFRP
jgi:hypothetical protein